MVRAQSFTSSPTQKNKKNSPRSSHLPIKADTLTPSLPPRHPPTNPHTADIQLPPGVSPPTDESEEPNQVDPNAPEKWNELALQFLG